MRAMRILYEILIGALSAAAVAGCGKEHAYAREGDAITFVVMSHETKAVEVGELSSFNVLATSGTRGAMTDYWEDIESATERDGIYYTEKRWPASDAGLSFAASNADISFTVDGGIVEVEDCGTDIVCAWLPYGSGLGRAQADACNAIEFNHILTRLCEVSVYTQTGYTLSDVSVTLNNGVTSGIYNIVSEEWSDEGEGAASALAVFSGTSVRQDSENDLWLVPGTYTFTVSYSLTRLAHTDTFTKTAMATLVAGACNSIDIDAIGGDAKEIESSVTIRPWNTRAREISLN